MNSCKIAVVGATGAVGQVFLDIADQRHFPIDEIRLCASERSVGKKIEFRSQEIEVELCTPAVLDEVDFAFISASGDVSREVAPLAANRGTVAIDDSSAFRMDADVPLVVPEVNANALDEFFQDENRTNIISNPNCSTIQMVVALKPLHDEAIINRVVISTYQSVSGAGQKAMDELFNQTKDIYSNKKIEKNKFTKQISFNAIPHIGSFLENGNTEEEQKMIDETKKIIDKGIKISATCVRIPVFIGHSESINIEFDSYLSEERAKELLEKFENVSVIDYRKDEGYVTPVEIAGEDKVFISRIRKDEGYITPVEIAGEDKVYVSRIRNDDSIDNGLSIWVVSDNLRKGAALNAVQIAELLISDYAEKILI